jgi:hypothetical protein
MKSVHSRTHPCGCFFALCFESGLHKGDFLLKGSNLCLALKDFSARLITFCVGRNVEWVRTFIGQLQAGLGTNELENQIKQLGKREMELYYYIITSDAGV